MKKILTVIVITFCVSSLKAQEKTLGTGRYQHTASDSVITQFYNKVYRCFYNPAYMANSTTTAAVLKVDIDKMGKVTGITFSDSADSIFRKAFDDRKNVSADYSTLEKYASIKKYTGLSLLIPVYFEPNYPKQLKNFNYDELEGLWKFESKKFEGLAIFMPGIFIRVAKTGNM